MNTQGQGEWWMALTGLAFVIVGVASFTIVGDVPVPPDDSARQIAQFYEDNEAVVVIGSLLAVLSGLLFVVFGVYLRQVMRAAQPDPSGDLAPMVLVVGTGVFTAGLALDSALHIALLENAGEVSPAATVALSALWNNDFPLFAAGLMFVVVSLAVSTLRHGVLPKWTGWVAVALVVVSATPIGFAGFLGSLAYLALVSVLLTLRARQPVAPVPAAA